MSPKTSRSIVRIAFQVYSKMYVENNKSTTLLELENKFSEKKSYVT